MPIEWYGNSNDHESKSAIHHWPIDWHENSNDYESILQDTRSGLYRSLYIKNVTTEASQIMYAYSREELLMVRNPIL